MSIYLGSKDIDDFILQNHFSEAILEGIMMEKV